ncbi:hypothetical protein BDP81DRAFT_451998 [Colletotrichum phormii]|uniref:Uncharacterized protein n=1 Tax=Colletotrichum phormii TaxID=359342 RepID=A0AAI9ZLF4_9PEZI|nr:uncharacterized protein BDP81DRAFT_451998 [Colletotrichum phormii]KAK1634069.1 hypothetical protein BDP81DRAFT_451998 [Colletotrichum phormii]
MKSQHIALPGLQAVAVAFLGARGASAGKVFCADANNKVVADTKCDSKAPANTFYMFNSEGEHPVGSTVDESQVDLYDSADMIERQNARFPPDYEMELEGFGKRQECGGGGSRGG